MVNYSKIRRGYSQIAENMFGHSLVERDGMTKGIGKSIRDVICVQQSGNLRFAAETIHAFSNIKNKIPAVVCGKPASQRFYVANSISLKTVI